MCVCAHPFLGCAPGHVPGWDIPWPSGHCDRSQNTRHCSSPQQPRRLHTQTHRGVSESTRPTMHCIAASVSLTVIDKSRRIGAWAQLGSVRRSLPITNTQTHALWWPQWRPRRPPVNSSLGAPRSRTLVNRLGDVIGSGPTGRYQGVPEAPCGVQVPAE